jgi:hypothetical protein
MGRWEHDPDHVGTTMAFLAAGLFVMPALLRFLSSHKWNVLAQHSPIAWIMTVLLAYVGVAGILDVTIAFAGFLAGFGIVGGMKASERPRFAERSNDHQVRSRPDPAYTASSVTSSLHPRLRCSCCGIPRRLVVIRLLSVGLAAHWRLPRA